MSVEKRKSGEKGGILSETNLRSEGRVGVAPPREVGRTSEDDREKPESRSGSGMERGREGGRERKGGE